jgi:hypothetical protein
VRLSLPEPDGCSRSRKSAASLIWRKAAGRSACSLDQKRRVGVLVSLVQKVLNGRCLGGVKHREAAADQANRVVSGPPFGVGRTAPQAGRQAEARPRAGRPAREGSSGRRHGSPRRMGQLSRSSAAKVGLLCFQPNAGQTARRRLHARHRTRSIVSSVKSPGLRGAWRRSPRSDRRLRWQ